MRKYTVAVVGKRSTYSERIAKELFCDTSKIVFRTCCWEFTPSPGKSGVLGCDIWARPTMSGDFEARLEWFAKCDYMIVLPERGQSTDIEVAVAEHHHVKIIDTRWVINPRTRRFLNDNKNYAKIENLIKAADYLYGDEFPRIEEDADVAGGFFRDWFKYLELDE